ncbi:bacillithiol biosynthesis BshC [Candidatus Bipolaricaulota bacterium]|nr:bacillithiol biosynthesis BshC [Candidatus Bipolaricaulota bacterium]
MSQTIAPHLLYGQSTFFLDYIEGKPLACQSFAHSITSLPALAKERVALPDLRTRTALCNVLLDYNHGLDASARAIANIEQLRSSETLCVIGGQQAEFLGGPLFVLYKIISIIQTAVRLSKHLDVPVIPIFWLASEDHDFGEINHTRWIDDSGALRTIAFEWDGKGRPIEQLPITGKIQQALDEAQEKLRFLNASDADLFAPESSDDYCTWHARLWSRLFADYGLVIVEPRAIRPLAAPFFTRVLNEPLEITNHLTQGAQQLTASDYDVLLDPEQSGGLFTIAENDARRRLDPLSSSRDFDVSTTYSADAALRPLLADSLFPTVANILGPSELAYHAMLRPLYEHWKIPQPLAIPRQGATLLSRKEADLLSDFGIDLSEALVPTFNPLEVAKRTASEDLRSEFKEARSRISETLLPLKDTLGQIDPGLEARWHQVVDQMHHQLDRLEERASRADLARRGLSVKHLQTLKPILLPKEKPQERILSGFSMIAKYGVKWIHDMIASEDPTRSDAPSPFKHQLIVLEEPHE